MKDNLVISEKFLSHQGEGRTAGRLAYFIRLAGCNLTCGINHNTFSKAKKENWTQEQIVDNKAQDALWVCDTMSIWMQGKNKAFEELLYEINLDGFSQAVSDGAHLIMSGGEPLLWQKNIIKFIRFLSTNGLNPPIEIETNGTVLPSVEIEHLISYWNISPKLSNSAMPLDRRIKLDSMSYFSKNEKAMFKFVIGGDEDITEVLDLVSTFQIDKRKVWLMPAASSIEELLSRNKSVAELALKQSFNFSSRLQVEIYNKTTGV
jgi:organic radical activating enzyme